MSRRKRGVRAVPPVDGLLRIAHGAHVVAGAAPRLEQAELERVHVLQLVDVEVPVPPPLRRGEALVLLEGTGAERQQVVEVHEAGPLLVALIAPVGLGHDVGLQGRSAPGGHHGVGVGVRGDHPRLGPLDLRRQLGHGRAAAAAAALRRDLGQHAGLAIEQRRWGATLVGPPGPQRPPGHGVEGACRRVAPQAQAPEPGRQLTRRLPGEREGEHVPGIRGADRHPVGDAPGEHAGLAGSRRRQEHEGLGPGGDGEALLAVQPLEQRLGIHGGRG